MLTADFAVCPYCGSRRIDGNDYDAVNATMSWSDGQDAHGLAAGQIADTRARGIYRRCRDCGGVWTEEDQG